jgi:cell wall-associated NlpC family hydrolase/LysM repeat protein
MNNRHFHLPIYFVVASAFLIAQRVPAQTTQPAPLQVLPLAQPDPGTTGVSDPHAPLPAEPAGPSTYTVIHGGTVEDVAHKCHCSARSLKKLNHLKSSRVKAGQVLMIPAPRMTSNRHKSFKAAQVASSYGDVPFHSRRAEPVQDFDLPASTFASCPVPVTPDDDAVPPAEVAPPEAQAVAEPLPAPAPRPVTAAVTPLPLPLTRHAPQPAPETWDADNFSSTAPVAPPVPVARPVHHGFFSFFESNPPPPADDWGTRFTQAARDLADKNIEYDEAWRPPGESHEWAMDCSNTSRYLYRVAANIELPRTASDQYYYLHLQNKAWDVPQTAGGFADCNYLRENLKAGDLLFWENTYRPERQPPITHVMIFLGTNERGDWIMAGSQSSRGGEHNRRHGGPDIYVFDPTKPCGGYTTWLGLVHHQGRFCAYGRPLEADKSKLAVAAND